MVQKKATFRNICLKSKMQQVIIFLALKRCPWCNKIQMVVARSRGELEMEQKNMCYYLVVDTSQLNVKDNSDRISISICIYMAGGIIMRQRRCMCEYDCRLCGSLRMKLNILLYLFFMVC